MEAPPVKQPRAGCSSKTEPKVSNDANAVWVNNRRRHAEFSSLWASEESNLGIDLVRVALYH